MRLKLWSAREPGERRTWIGGFAFSNLLAIVFLAIGAILRVIYEVTRLLLRAKRPVLSAPNLGGFVGGVAIMYATALLVSV
jgi:zinc transporter, ZIP family